ncbi:MAG TPA: hypothetical protein PLW65_02030 [Pseudomonadota bacterium]|nr:hypothetical protein [Pseudomonadota bacterium]
MPSLTANIHRTIVLFLSVVLALLVVLTMRTASAQPMAPLPAAVPEGYAAQISPPAWRAAFPARSAFGSLCSLAPLACALIDTPFAFNARLDLVIRPKAFDGSTGVLLPFAVSVPLFGRAEIGLGSCYAGFWGLNDDAAKSNAGPSINSPSGLCPVWLAAKLLVFPWFRDPHTHPALAAEYQFEYQAGPFSGLNQLRLPGHLSKFSLAYRHPLGRLELGAAVSAFVDHTTRTGTLQLGPHVGYRLPVGEHFWLFAQAIVQAPSWGPVIPSAAPGQTLNLAPPIAGTLAVGAQQRADFGFGVGLTLMLTKSEIDTRVDFLFRLLSFELGPHIKPLIPARETHNEPLKVAVAVKPEVAPQLECPAGYRLAPAPRPSTQPAGTIPKAQPSESQCVPISPAYRLPSPLWGKPCYLAPLDGSASLRMGNIDSTGQYCEWDGVRLPLGAVIDPPQRVPHSELENPSLSAPTSKSIQVGAAMAPTPPVQPRVSAHKAAAQRRSPELVVAAEPSPTSGGTSQPITPRLDRIERVTELPPSVPGSPFASGFVDGVKESSQHLRDLYRVIKKHGPGVVVPSREAAEEWVNEVKAQCLDHLDDCARGKAKEAAQALNEFRQKPWEDKKYTLGHWSWSVVEATAENAVIAVLPGGGAALRWGEKAAEEAAVKGAAKAAVKKTTEEAAAHGGEVAVRKAAKEAAEAEAKAAAEAEAKRAVKEAEQRAAGAARNDAGREFTQEQKDLVEMAKKDKQKGGISIGDMEAYKQLNAEAGARGFATPGAVRGPEVHPLRSQHSQPGPGQKLHGHVGPVDHIPIK